MAKKEITTQFKLQAPGGTATPAPPIGPALGQHGVNPGQFIQKFNAMSAHLKGKVVGCLVTVYKDRTFDIELKSSPDQRPAQGRGQGREGQRRTEQDQDRQDHHGPVQGHREGEGQGPQLLRRRPRRAHRRGDGAVDGDYGRRMNDLQFAICDLQLSSIANWQSQIENTEGRTTDRNSGSFRRRAG